MNTKNNSKIFNIYIQKHSHDNTLVTKWIDTGCVPKLMRIILEQYSYQIKQT